jgi:hypothetical protein
VPRPVWVLVRLLLLQSMLRAGGRRRVANLETSIAILPCTKLRAVWDCPPWECGSKRCITRRCT